MSARRDLFLASILLFVLGFLTITKRELAPEYDIAMGLMFIVGAIHGFIAAMRWENRHMLFGVGVTASTGACIGRMIEVAVWSEQRPWIGMFAWALNALGVWSIFSRAVRAVVFQRQIVVEK